MRPPLARPIDREALWANLDAVDCIATDHAPHARAEKLVYEDGKVLAEPGDGRVLFG